MQIDEKQIQYWRANPVQAALDIFGAADPDFDLDRPQRAIIQSRWTHQYELDILGRGMGKTFLNAVTAWLQAILYPGQRVGLVAPSFRQSKMIWAEVEKLWEISPILQECVAHGPSITPEKCYVKLKSAPGRVGSVIEALPMGTDGAKIRGARYYFVIADELAQIDENVLDIVVGGFLATSQNPMRKAKLLRRLKAQLEAGQITQEEYETLKQGGNRFIGSTTAFYQYNHVWKRVQNLIAKIYDAKASGLRRGDNTDHLVVKGGALNGGQMPARYLSDGKDALCVFPFWDMVEGFMDMESVERQRRIMSDYLFRMEYCCYFPPDSEGFFRRSLLDAARHHNRFSPRLRPVSGVEYVMGIDPARTGDHFAVSLVEVDTQLRQMRLVRVWAWKNKPFPDAHREVRNLIREFRVKLIKMDSGGGGTTIRDLLADHRSCPPGEHLILEQEKPEHLALNGERILAPLVEFSKYEWVKDTNEGLKSALEHGIMLIAAHPPVPGEIWVPECDEADKEIEETIVEMSSVITKSTGSRISWDTPTKNQRKDRYSATLLAYDAARTLLGNLDNPNDLAQGFWG